MARHVRRSGPWRRAIRACSVVLVSVGVGIGLGVAWFYAHDSIDGRALLAQAEARIAASVRHRPAAGRSTSKTAGCASARGGVGELVIPSLSLVAPVVQGDGQAQLSDAVGHVPTSVWPGGTGTTVLVAHDVTWFHELNHVRTGAVVEFVSGCSAYTYRIERAQVVAQGSTVANVAGSLDLVTCWPLDALWFTGQRYLVQATAVGGTATAAPVKIAAGPVPPPLAVPKSLSAVDTLAQNPTPLGGLRVRGRPARDFDESSGPLVDAAAAESVFFAAQRAAEAGSASEWAVVAPGVSSGHAAPLQGAAVTDFGASLSVTLDVSGDELVGATLGLQEVLTTRKEWTIVVSEGIVGGRLAVIGWKMTTTGTSGPSS